MDIKTLNNSWSDWLRVNSEAYFLSDNLYQAWQDVDGAHSPHLELTEQIGLFYKKLPPLEQLLFRQGLVDCLLTMPRHIERVALFVFLIELATEVDCYELAASDFYTKMAFHGKLGYFKNQGEVETQAIYYAIMKSLRHFSASGTGSSHRIALLMGKMIRHERFPIHHTHLALLILSKSQPEKVFQHWLKVRHLHAQFMQQYTGAMPFNPSVLRMELLRILDVEQMASLVRKIWSMPDIQMHDIWLIDVLTNPEHSFFRLASESDVSSTFYLSDQRDKTRNTIALNAGRYIKASSGRLVDDLCQAGWEEEIISLAERRGGEVLTLLAFRKHVTVVGLDKELAVRDENIALHVNQNYLLQQQSAGVSII